MSAPQEHILCAAIYVDTGKAEPARRSYSYPATGLVFSGWRHGDCFTTLNAWGALLTEEERFEVNYRDLVRVHPESELSESLTEDQRAGMRGSVRGFDQGFLTSKGRYVGRKEAAVLAIAANQMLRENIRAHEGMDLWSEDLY